MKQKKCGKWKQEQSHIGPRAQSSDCPFVLLRGDDGVLIVIAIKSIC
jgi:hypothetical protein